MHFMTGRQTDGRESTYKTAIISTWVKRFTLARNVNATNDTKIANSVSARKEFVQRSAEQKKLCTKRNGSYNDNENCK